MKISRKFTQSGKDPFASVEWVKRSSRISNPDGSVVFQMDDAEVPSSWSQLATDIMVSKYFRKAGVPISEGKEKELGSESRATKTGPEKSAKQVIHRLAGCWRQWGEQHDYFDSKGDAQAFYDELVHMLVHQIAAPNSPQWFNTGLNFAYGITGPAQGHFVPDPESGEVKLAHDAYTHPQPHACFIQSVDDDLVNPGGIMDLWVREARLFKYGSGTGTNFSRLRGENEPLSGGGKSSGLMSWLRIGDRAAGAIKSGGTTRRAAKMVCLDLDHPDVEQFINWKVREEIKVQALVEGMKSIAGKKASIHDHETIGETAGRLGLKLDYDFNGESYYTVSGQNSNNSIRISDEFFDCLDKDGTWALKPRLGSKGGKDVKASDLWGQIGYAAWRCADPGVQYDSTINAWHTCPASGRINASNPCSEYMFLDNTACNLASINLLKFYDPVSRQFDVERYEHAIDLWTMVLEISVLMAMYPSREIAKLSWRYRTLGLGYANIGAMLMQAGVPYDSEESRALCGMMSSILTGRSYRMSALMAKEHGPFAGYSRNRESMLRVMRNHRRAAYGVRGGSALRAESEKPEKQDSARRAEPPEGDYENLRIRPVPIDHGVAKSEKCKIKNSAVLLERSCVAWDEALAMGEKHGYRNAQTTVIAPTGTIGLLMDCDTTGVEPDFALVKFKKLAGGGYFKIANQSVEPALLALGLNAKQIKDVLTYVLGTLDLNVPMPAAGEPGDLAISFVDWLKQAGLNDGDFKKITAALPGVFEIGFAFSAWTLGEETLTRIGIDPAAAKADGSFNLLKKLGLTAAQIEVLNERICGTQTVEGAPHLTAEQIEVFDCANTCGKKGKRFIRPEGHIRMMAAAQPFISGAISKTINLPNNAGIEDIKAAYRLSWELGLKANALYRDGCKLSQPLSTKSEDSSASGVVEDKPSKTTAKVERLKADVTAMLDQVEEDADALGEAHEEIAEELREVVVSTTKGDRETVIKATERIVHRPMRRRLPDTRRSITHKFNIAGHEGYLTVGLYDDNAPGELFITMAKEGSTIGGLMDSLGTATSVSLQYGVPIESLVKKFTHQRFEPAGMTTNRDIPFAKSLVDYIFRWMGIQFIPGYREQVVPSTALDDPNESRDIFGDRTTVMSSGGEGGGARSVQLDPPKRTAVVPAMAMAGARAEAPTGVKAKAKAKPTSALNAALQDCQEDAPACEVCGTITVRNGTCYKCLNCGHSMGCS